MSFFVLQCPFFIFFLIYKPANIVVKAIPTPKNHGDWYPIESAPEVPMRPKDISKSGPQQHMEAITPPRMPNFRNFESFIKWLFMLLANGTRAIAMTTKNTAWIAFCLYCFLTSLTFIKRHTGIGGNTDFLFMAAVWTCYDSFFHVKSG